MPDGSAILRRLRNDEVSSWVAAGDQFAAEPVGRKHVA